MKERVRKNKDCQLTFPIKYWASISAEAKEIVIKLTNPDPSFRISAKEALQSEWLTKYALKIPARHIESDILEQEIGENSILTEITEDNSQINHHNNRFMISMESHLIDKSILTEDEINENLLDFIDLNSDSSEFISANEFFSSCILEDKIKIDVN